MKYKLEEINCNYCGSNNYSIYIKGAKELYNGLEGTFDVVKCNQCGFIFTNPRPTKETISYFYPDKAGYYQPQKVKKRPMEKKRSFKRHVFESILTNHYGYNFIEPFPKVVTFLLFYLFRSKMDASHLPRMVQNGKLLDIGCSWGGYIYEMQQLGWDVSGIEINKKAVEYAKNKLKLNDVHCSFIEEIELNKNYFNVVRMSMVLEHLFDPLFALRKIQTLMASGGQLILSIPDISGFETQVYKSNSYCLQVPEHLNHFTPKTIKAFLNRSGLRVERIIHQNFDRDLVASAGYLKNKVLYRLLSNKLVRNVLVKWFISFLSILGKTSRMTVYARKING